MKSIRKSVDSPCRNGDDTSIVFQHRKAFSTHEHERFKPFWAYAILFQHFSTQ